MRGDTILAIPQESHRPMREAIAPCLSLFNAPADIKGFIVIAVGADDYEMRTDMCPAEAQAWLMRTAIALGEDH